MQSTDQRLATQSNEVIERFPLNLAVGCASGLFLAMNLLVFGASQDRAVLAGTALMLAAIFFLHAFKRRPTSILVSMLIGAAMSVVVVAAEFSKAAIITGDIGVAIILTVEWMFRHRKRK